MDPLIFENIEVISSDEDKSVRRGELRGSTQLFRNELSASYYKVTSGIGYAAVLCSGSEDQYFRLEEGSSFIVPKGFEAYISGDIAVEVTHTPPFDPNSVHYSSENWYTATR